MVATLQDLKNAKIRLDFVDRYFQAVHATTLLKKDSYREIQLPTDVDKELNPRPFYWMWIETTGQKPEPTVLRMAFDQPTLEKENQRMKVEHDEKIASLSISPAERWMYQAPKAQLVDYGSFLLDKILASVKKRGAFAIVAPKNLSGSKILIPWLMMNGMFTFRCDMSEQKLWSVAICLENGQIVDEFYNKIRHIEMNPISPQKLLYRLRMSLIDGFQALQTYLEFLVKQQPTDWAEKSLARLEQEQAHINLYYNSLLEDADLEKLDSIKIEHERKLKSLSELYYPTIDIIIEQMALIGLPSS